jgi:hypothetical protein
VGRPLARRVVRLERSRPGCRLCGGRGRVAVVYPARGQTAAGRPGCRSCGRVLVVEVNEIPVGAWHGCGAG